MTEGGVAWLAGREDLDEATEMISVIVLQGSFWEIKDSFFRKFKKKLVHGRPTNGVSFNESYDYQKGECSGSTGRRF